VHHGPQHRARIGKLSQHDMLREAPPFFCRSIRTREMRAATATVKPRRERAAKKKS
jgi:hypothetical protein